MWTFTVLLRDGSLRLIKCVFLGFYVSALGTWLIHVTEIVEDKSWIRSIVELRLCYSRLTSSLDFSRRSEVGTGAFILILLDLRSRIGF